MAETVSERLAAAWARTGRIFELPVGDGRGFRTWFQAHYPYVFAKFRCVASPPSGGTR